MISRTQRAEIRRLFFAEHWPFGTIAAQLDVSFDAVRAAVEHDTFRPLVSPLRASTLDPYKPFVHETLERFPTLRASRLFEMVRARGFEGSVKTLRRYVRGVRPARRREAFLRLTTLPGEQAQVDWASFGSITIRGAKRKLSCFVMVLSHSRAMYARFFLDQTMPSFLRGHVLGFEALGGAPREILYDNLKSAVLERVDSHIRFHPALLELAGHYHYLPKPCAPYRGNEKGRVERQIQYLRHAFFAARPFADLDDLNAQLARWIEQIAHERVAPEDAQGRTVKTRWEQERPQLLPLPKHPHPCALVRATSAAKTPYLRFDDNDYSIPAELVGVPLTLLADEACVRVMHEEREVARHVRSYGRKERIEDRAHLAELTEHKRAARALRGRDGLRAQCAHADALLAAMAARNQPMAMQTARLLKLLEQYGATALDEAIAAALARGAPSAASIAYALDQRARAKGQAPVIPYALPHGSPAAQVHVRPHALGPYDALGAPGREGSHE